MIFHGAREVRFPNSLAFKAVGEPDQGGGSSQEQDIIDARRCCNCLKYLHSGIQMYTFDYHQNCRQCTLEPAPVFKDTNSTNRILSTAQYTSMYNLYNHLRETQWLQWAAWSTTSVPTSNFTPHFGNHNRREATVADKIYHMIPSLFSFYCLPS